MQCTREKPPWETGDEVPSIEMAVRETEAVEEPGGGPAHGLEEKLGRLQAQLGAQPKGQPADAVRPARRDPCQTPDVWSGGNTLVSF